MKTLISTVKAMQLKRFVMVALVGVLVLFSTACSRPETIADRVTDSAATITPGQAQSYKGGINNFNDDDSTRLNTEAATKAKALKDKVQSRINAKGIKSSDDLIDNVRAADPGKQAQRLGADVREQFEDVKDNLQTFGDRGAKNLKKNTDNAIDTATDAVSDAKDTAKSKADRDIKTTKRTVDQTASAAKSKVSNDVEVTKRALNSALDKAS